MKTRTTLHKRLMHSLLALMGATVVLCPWVAQAQQVPVLSTADKQAIASYNLTDDNFTRLIGATKEAHDEGIKPQQPKDFSSVHNLDDLANLPIAQDKRIAPLLKKFGFTPRDFLLANLALMNAGIAVQAKSNPDAAKYMDQSRINPANVSFYEAHEPQIAALQAEFEDGNQ